MNYNDLSDELIQEKILSFLGKIEVLTTPDDIFIFLVNELDIKFDFYHYRSILVARIIYHLAQLKNEGLVFEKYVLLSDRSPECIRYWYHHRLKYKFMDNSEDNNL